MVTSSSLDGNLYFQCSIPMKPRRRTAHLWLMKESFTIWQHLKSESKISKKVIKKKFSNPTTLTGFVLKRIDFFFLHTESKCKMDVFVDKKKNNFLTCPEPPPDVFPHVVTENLFTLNCLSKLSKDGSIFDKDAANTDLLCKEIAGFNYKQFSWLSWKIIQYLLCWNKIRESSFHMKAVSNAELTVGAAFGFNLTWSCPSVNNKEIKLCPFWSDGV